MKKWIVVLVMMAIFIGVGVAQAETLKTIILYDNTRNVPEIQRFIERLKPQYEVIPIEFRRINIHKSHFGVTQYDEYLLWHALKDEQKPYDLVMVLTNWSLGDWMKIVLACNWLGMTSEKEKVMILKCLHKQLFEHELAHIKGWSHQEGMAPLTR